MAEYIGREAAIKLFNFAVLDCLGMEPTIRAGDIIKALESIPAADVRSVVRGRWLLLTKEEMRNRGTFGFLWASDSWMNYECSECGEMVHNGLNDKGDHRTNFCPNCGADMREES